MNVGVSQNNAGMVNLRHQNVKQKTRENKEQRKVNARGSQNNEGMENLHHHNLKIKVGENQFVVVYMIYVIQMHISDHSMKSKNPSRIWYYGSVPGKDVFERLDSRNPSTTITRKESRALSANRKSRFNQRKLVFEIDDCAGRIVVDDSQTFITKGGCVVREGAVFDGRTWKKQLDLLKEDIISKTTILNQHSLARAMKTQLATHHRTRQYILHKHYQKYPTKDEATTHLPNGVKVAEWVLLCDSIRMDLNSEKEKSKLLEKDHLELKENHLKLQKEHEDYDTEDYEDYDEAQDDGM
ncbi:hypothetical protein Tco_0772264 [Tanacetum coccineum]|uniref:Uncharacterized protein n=1 Tax=Tanacetum coccineum TaxID=301880 RepID=A0ABQ4ZL65_9ASTR